MPDPTDTPGSNGDHDGSGLSRKDRAGFEKRLSSLDDKLNKTVTPREKARKEAASSARVSGRGMAYGMRMATELVAAVIVGGLIGYGLDYFLGTKPWLFLLFFILGFAAGIVNLMRAYKRMQADINEQTGGYLGEDLPDNDDET